MNILDLLKFYLNFALVYLYLPSRIVQTSCSNLNNVHRYRRGLFLVITSRVVQQIIVNKVGTAGSLWLGMRMVHCIIQKASLETHSVLDEFEMSSFPRPPCSSGFDDIPASNPVLKTNKRLQAHRAIHPL